MDSIRDRWKAAKDKTASFFHKAVTGIPWAAANVALGFLAGGALFPFLTNDPLNAISGLLGGASTNIITSWLLEYSRKKGTEPEPAEFIAVLGEALEESHELRLAIEELIGKFGAGDLMDIATEQMDSEVRQRFYQLFQEEWSRFRQTGEFSSFEPTPSGTLIQKIENPTLIREGDRYYFTADQRQWIGAQFQAPIYGPVIIPAPEHKPLPWTPRKGAVPINNLPQREPFFGRASELRDVEETLSRSVRIGLISIEGIGGSGKTALALEAAHRALDARSFDAIIWTTAKERILTWAGIQILAPDFTTVDGLLNRILVLLNEPKKANLPTVRKWDHVFKLLTDRRCLVIVDNLETVKDHDVYRFLVRIPQPSKAIVTNRHAPAPLRPAYPIILEKGMERASAYELLRNEATNLKVHSISDADEGVLAEIYDQTYGWPMVMKWVVWQVWQGRRINDTLDRLAETSENDLHEFIFQESYKTLGHEGVRVIQALAAIGSTTSEDIICYVGDLKPGFFEKGWRQIWRVRLATYDDQHHLYSLHPMTREFVLGLMDQRRIAALDKRISDLPIKLAYDRLDENLQQMLWSLAGFDKPVSSRIWQSASQLDEDLFNRGLDQLLRLALVNFDRQRRLYSMHPRVRDFALNQLDEPARAKWLALARAAIPDYKTLRHTYLEHLRSNFHWLDFRGIVQVGRLIRVPLMSIYVPLQVRVQEREFEPWLHHQMNRDMYPPREETGTKGIGELIQEHRRIVILGDPGSGKTTLLRYLALTLAEGHQSIERRLGITENLLPILIPVAAYASTLQREPDLALSEYLPRYFAGQGLPDLLPLLENELTQGRCLILIDGLDETVAPEQRLQIIRNIEDFVELHNQNRFVVTSRIVGYRETPLAGEWQHYTLVDFTMLEIERFVRHWCLAYEMMATEDESAANIEADKKSRRLLEAISANPHIHALATNPLLLTVIALTYTQGLRLPEHRISLFDIAVDLLTETWKYGRSLSQLPIEAPFSAIETIRILSQVALRTHETEAAGLISEPRLRSIIMEILADEGLSSTEVSQRTEDFFTMLRHQGNVLIERGLGVYGFIHLAFEEDFAARALAQSRTEDRNKFVLSHLSDPVWHEVILLLLARLAIIEARRSEVSDLLAMIVETDQEGILLASEFLRDAGARSVEPQIRGMIIERLATLFRDVSTPLSKRLAAGTILGELGYIAPDMVEMVQVPVGPFVMGCKLKEYEDQQPAHEVVVGNFLMRKYPVTNFEYKEFVENGGYQDKRYWTEDGWKYISSLGIAAPEYWDHSLWNGPNFPAVGISWYEATAYCAWLTEKLHQQGDLSGEEVIRLPTEAEWEKAAKGVGSHRWPWGDEFDSSRANTAESNLGRTTPVGTYPTGVSPYGIEEMAGNVWEWCSSLYRPYPYQPVDGRESLRGDGQRVLRGGSWGDDQDYARTTFRGKAQPVSRFSTIGFRYVQAIRTPG